MIMGKHGTEEMIYKLFDIYYQAEDITGYTDRNLDKGVEYYDNDDIRVFYTVNMDGKIYLSYRKSDRDSIKKLIPISNNMFGKYIKGWFKSKFNMEVYDLLIPR